MNAFEDIHAYYFDTVCILDDCKFTISLSGSVQTIKGSYNIHVFIVLCHLNLKQNLKFQHSIKINLILCFFFNTVKMRITVTLERIFFFNLNFLNVEVLKIMVM